jgi:hypothetical protein
VSTDLALVISMHEIDEGAIAFAPRFPLFSALRAEVRNIML